MTDLETENLRLRKALKLVSERLLAFVCAVGDITDCSADVAALDVARDAMDERVAGDPRPVVLSKLSPTETL